MEKGKIRRLMLQALNELEPGEFNSGEIAEKMLQISDYPITADDLSNEIMVESAEYLADKGLITWKPLKEWGFSSSN